MAFERALYCRTVDLTDTPLFVRYVKALDDKHVCGVSPDPGGAERAGLFREALEEALGCPINKASGDKHRSAGIVSSDIFAMWRARRH